MILGKKEDIALELILSIIQTRKPVQVIEDAVESFMRKGDRKVVASLEHVKEMVAGGEDYIQAFYSAGFLGEETYSFLSVMSIYGGLGADVLRDYMKSKRALRDAMKKGFLASFQPVLAVVVAVVLSAVMVPTFARVYEETTKPEFRPFFYSIYDRFADHPVLGSILLLLSVLFLLFFLYLAVYRVFLSKERWLVELSAYFLNLRKQYVPYHEILDFLASRERSEKRRSFYETLSSSVRELPVDEAFLPLFDFFPISLAIVVRERLRTGEEASAWEIAKREMLSALETKLEILNNFSPVIAYAVTFFLILFALVPAFLALISTLSSLSLCSYLCPNSVTGGKEGDALWVGSLPFSFSSSVFAFPSLSSLSM